MNTERKQRFEGFKHAAYTQCVYLCVPFLHFNYPPTRIWFFGKQNNKSMQFIKPEMNNSQRTVLSGKQ